MSHMQKFSTKMVNPRGIVGNAEEEEDQQFSGVYRKQSVINYANRKFENLNKDCRLLYISKS